MRLSVSINFEASLCLEFPSRSSGPSTSSAMHFIALVSLVLGAASGVSAMTLVHRNDTPIARSSSADFTGGHASFYYQNGLAGACGVVHSDSSFIAALQTTRYGPVSAMSPNCGRSITLTNTNNAKSVTVVVADVCVTCSNENDLDLSIGAFLQISTLADGYVPIVWHYND
ncbi:hypothetical protein GSI_03649 [Ganoderma sinense ZZ0214-1]|uniref:RlpA-like protein double-psi beta-barrel domain-containing protein n=1 Tax=Ganoderma sinense ZZ0214-1 TaxID=1077348 RepID=A0A2G8SJJ5_9APHY|nr:hypothetical protein GSI_03649 [Ganoderma sinense ZZ0214-1]